MQTRNVVVRMLVLGAKAALRAHRCPASRNGAGHFAMHRSR
ncbi:hypothetical protein [Streptomyces scabichelini]|nr:hypothetical protein [Streptomyces scabichelini]